MTFALARSLLLADAVTPAAMAQALLLAATRGTSQGPEPVLRLHGLGCLLRDKRRP